MQQGDPYTALAALGRAIDDAEEKRTGGANCDVQLEAAAREYHSIIAHFFPEQFRAECDAIHTAIALGGNSCDTLERIRDLRDDLDGWLKLKAARS